jgi:hypothetical protein
VPRSVRQVNMPHVVYVDLEDEHARTELALAWRASDTSDVLRVFLGVAQSVSHPHLEQAGAGVSHIA